MRAGLLGGAGQLEGVVRVVGADAGDHLRPVADRVDDGAESCSFSASLVVGLSPVVPLMTSPSLPWSTRCVASRAAPSRSSEPSARNGVAIAVSTRPKGRPGIEVSAMVEGYRPAARAVVPPISAA